MTIKGMKLANQEMVGRLHAEANVDKNCVSEQVEDIIRQHYKGWSGDTRYKSCCCFTTDYRVQCYGSDYAYESDATDHEDGSVDIIIMMNRYEVIEK